MNTHKVKHHRNSDTKTVNRDHISLGTVSNELLGGFNLFYGPNDFLKYIYQISIKFWITNTLLHKLFQTDMIFFNQLKVPTIEFGKCFAEFMIPIALLKKFGS